MRLRPRQTFGGCVSIWSHISCKIFQSVLAFSSFFLHPSFFLLGLFYRLWPEGLMKAATQQRKERQAQKETQGSLCCLCWDKRRIWQNHMAASKTPIYWSGLSLHLLCQRERERESKKTHKRYVWGLGVPPPPAMGRRKCIETTQAATNHYDTPAKHCTHTAVYTSKPRTFLFSSVIKLLSFLLFLRFPSFCHSKWKALPQISPKLNVKHIQAFNTLYKVNILIQNQPSHHLCSAVTYNQHWI